VLTIPIIAVQGNGNTGVVLVLDANNQAEQRSVAIGLRGSTLVEVTSGLQVGDRVLLGDASRFHEGERVVPQTQQEPANDIMHQEGGVTDPQESSGGHK
jgi:multidrug efflux pump subunit AcrA (membrane-fusion protein)